MVEIKRWRVYVHRIRKFSLIIVFTPRIFAFKFFFNLYRVHMLLRQHSLKFHYHCILSLISTHSLNVHFAVKIASDAFDSLTHLQHLYLKKNFIMHISERHLKNLQNLIILDLAANKIQKIHPNAFRSLTKLSELYMSQNFLNQIPENLFIAMKSLKRLMLFSNDFRYLHSGSFVGLRLCICHFLFLIWQKFKFNDFYKLAYLIFNAYSLPSLTHQQFIYLFFAVL